MVREIIPLWTHQREAARRAVTEGSYAFFMEVGTGKTLTTIHALRCLFTKEKRLYRTIIFCPPVVRRAWEREFRKASTIKAVTVLDGAGKDRLATFREKKGSGHVFITNYESLQMPDLFKEFKAWGPEALVFDESHRLKEIKAKRTKLAIELADMAKHRFILTGTPILNTPMDIWAQFRILDGGETFDRNFYAFRAKYFYDKNSNMPAHVRFPDWRPLPGIEEIFKQKIYAKASRVMKSECLDLPPLVRTRLEVELSPEQTKIYKDMKDKYIAYLNDKACVANTALTKGLRLQQMVSGIFTDEDGKDHVFSKNPRLEALYEYLSGIVTDHKCIVWVSFRRSYDECLSICSDLGVDAVTLVGGMTDKARQESIDRFQDDPKVRVIIANAAAGGVGVTLTAASYAIYYSRDFSLEHDLQSEARCHRGGSEVHEKITRVDIVAPGTIDEVILDALDRKENLASRILTIKELI